MLIHHHEGILTHEFSEIYHLDEAKRIAMSLIMDRFRFARYPNSPVLIYPFMQKKDYDPERLALGIAIAAVAVNENNYRRLPDFPIYGACTAPDIICRACGNLQKRPSSKTEFYCLSIIRQKNMNFPINTQTI